MERNLPDKRHQCEDRGKHPERKEHLRKNDFPQESSKENADGVDGDGKQIQLIPLSPICRIPIRDFFRLQEVKEVEERHKSIQEKQQKDKSPSETIAHAPYDRDGKHRRNDPRRVKHARNDGGESA